MKKLFIMIMAMSIFLVGCGSNNSNDSQGNKSNKEINLKSAISDIYKNVNINVEDKEYLQKAKSTELDPNDKELINSYFGGDYKFKKAVISEMETVPPAYLLSIIEVESNDEANKLASDIKNSFNIRRWVCVEPEVVETSVKDNLVFFVAGEKATTDELIKSFDKLNK